MNKKVVGGILALSLLLGSGSATFQDVKAPRLAQTAAVLNSLKIMQGDSSQTFSPNRRLTRAEFAKLLVTAFGVTDVSAYKNYTIFPDVPNSHWASGYINAAIKHPTVKEKGIIHGYADGTFKPDQSINYGEACTMMMLMLGYKVPDIGPMWPADYIARVQSEGLSDGASVMTASSAVSRGDAAIMLLNVLNTAGKEGDRLIASLTSSAGETNAILLATSATDPDLKSNQARFYTGTNESIVKNTEGVLDSALIGASGTLYYSKTSPNTVITILPNTDERSEDTTVLRVGRDHIEFNDGTKLKPERDVLLYVRGTVNRYAEAWFNILAGDEASLHYDSDGALTLISVVQRSAEGNSFVYGTETSASVPANFTITKSGVKGSIQTLKKYDVVTLDAASKSAIVSDMKLTGYYDSGLPSFKNPEKVSVLGTDYIVSEQAATYFAKLKPGDRITLLFDSRGEVAAAFPAATVRADMTGIFTDMVDGKAQISLLNGVTVHGTLQSDEYKRFMGQAVAINQNSDGTIYFGATSLPGKTLGDWDVEAGTLGTRKVSPHVRVWEQVADDAPYYEASISALPFGTIQASSIRNTVNDSAGNVTGIVLGDITGDAWNYGISSFSVSKEDDDAPNVAVLKHYDYDTKSESSLTYYSIRQMSDLNGTYVGLPKNGDQNQNQKYLASIRLDKVDKVTLSAFDASQGVRTSAGYYPISDEVQVYLRKQKKFVTLNQAKSDYDSFTLYAERTPDKGGKIRFITVD